METKVKRINIHDVDGLTKPHAITFSAFHTAHFCGPVVSTPPACTIGVPHKYMETKQQEAFYDG